MNKLKVLVVPTWYPSVEDKLMGIYHRGFCEALCACTDAEVNLLHIQRMRLQKPLQYLFAKKKTVDKRDGFSCYIYRMLNRGPISFELQRKAYLRRLERAYRDYLKTNPPPDVVHAHVVYPAGYACYEVFQKKRGIPVVLTEHGFFSTAMNDPRRKPFAELTLKNVVCSTVAEHQRVLYEGFGVECAVLRNVVDDSIFSNITHIPSPDGVYRITTACALRAGKRVDDIAAAMKLILQKGEIEKMRLTIIGDGFLENTYKKSVRDMGMDGLVDFVGRKTEAQIAEYLASTDLFVVSSDLESACIPGVQALMAGVQLVVTRCKGPQEYVDPQTGELCDIESPEDMARAIVAAYNKRGTYDTRKQAKYAARYTRNAVAQSALALYRKAIEKQAE